MKNPKSFPKDTPGAVPTKRGLLAERVGFVSGPAGRRQASHVYGLSDEAFARYLSEKGASGASNRQTATNVDAMGSSGISQSVTGDDDVTVRTSSKGRSDAAAANRNAATRGIKIFADNPRDQQLEIRLKNLKRASRCGASRTRADARMRLRVPTRTVRKTNVRSSEQAFLVAKNRKPMYIKGSQNQC